MHNRRLLDRLPWLALASIGLLAVVLALVLTAAGGAVQAAPNAQVSLAAPDATGCVSGHVWAYEGDKGLLPLVDWKVTATMGATVLTKMTDGAGYFKFDGLAPGKWTIAVEVKTGWAPYTGVPSSVQVDVVAGTTCADAWFKLSQVPTPTPTSGPPGTRIRGNVYELKCDGIYPLNNVELNVYKSSFPDSLGTLAQTRTTDPGGFYNFLITASPPPYYHLVVTPPAGLVPDSAFSLEGLVVTPDHILFAAPTFQVYEQNKFVLKDPNLKCGTDTPTPTPTDTPTPTVTPTVTPTPQTTGCIDGYVVDDLHVGLPGWEVHAMPDGAQDPNLMRITDGEGYYKFENLALGVWKLWVVPKVGWVAVTDEMFTVTVKPQNECSPTRFKFRQQTPTPTPTDTPTATVTPTEPPPPPPNPLYFPLILRPGGVCETGRLQVEVWGHWYNFPLDFNNIVHFVGPLPWQTSTTFHLVDFEGPVTWTQYLPFYHKQLDGYDFTFPGGYAGQDFKLFVFTECGLILIETSVDDPTPTPPAQNTNLPTPAPTVTPPLR
jgi:hypothetical protein